MHARMIHSEKTEDNQAVANGIQTKHRTNIRKCCCNILVVYVIIKKQVKCLLLIFYIILEKVIEVKGSIWIILN